LLLRLDTWKIGAESYGKAGAKLEEERNALLQGYARLMGGGLTLIADQWSKNAGDDYTVTVNQNGRNPPIAVSH
jgi:hypothetical protein